MKIGMLARAEDRGLGILTWEWARHVRPERTLLVDLGELARGFAQHPDRYDGEVVTGELRDGHFDERIVRRWLDGLDVVYSAETFYDWRIVEWAREAGVRTVCHMMPEFYRHAVDKSLPAPDVWWTPTTWRLFDLPVETRVVPVPVALDRWPMPGRRASASEPLRVLHSIGHRATADRNGTRALLQALRVVREPMHVTLHTQDMRMPSTRVPDHVELDAVYGGQANYWDVYAGHDVLVMPRRFGGLSMPVIEAAGAGLAVVMTDAAPQRTEWPFVLRVDSTPGRTVETPAGTIDTVDADPRSLARALDGLARDRAALTGVKRNGVEWAGAHSWEQLLPTILAELARCL